MDRSVMGRYSTWRQIVGAAIFACPAAVAVVVIHPWWEALVVWGFATFAAIGYGRMYYARGVVAGMQDSVDTPKEAT